MANTNDAYNTLLGKIDNLEKKIKSLEEDKKDSKGIKIQSGEYFEEFWKVKDHYLNNCNVGYRPVIKYISFKEQYKTPPQVLVSITGLECDNKSNSRVYISAKDITISGFNLEIATYGKSKIYYIRVNWMSFGN